LDNNGKKDALERTQAQALSEIGSLLPEEPEMLGIKVQLTACIVAFGVKNDVDVVKGFRNTFTHMFVGLERIYTISGSLLYSPAEAVVKFGE